MTKKTKSNRLRNVAISVAAVSLAFAAWLQWWTTYPAAEAPFGSPLDVPTIQFSLEGTEPQRIELPSGTTIDVPARAFLTQDGQVPDQVALSVREFHSAEDVLRSGILMQMGPGSDEHLQTAGMLEILASNNGQALKLQSPLSITMPADSALDEAFQMWTVDDAGRWVDAGDLDITANASRTEALARIDSTLAAQEQGPSESSLELEEPWRFTVEGDEERAPYLQPYQGVVWEWIPDHEGQPAPEHTLRSAWTECSIEKVRGEEYALTFTYEKTNTMSELILEKKQIKARPQNKKRDMKRREEAYALAKEAWEVEMASLREERMRVAAQGAFLLQFEVADLGLINVDKLEDTNDWDLVAMNFDFAPSIPFLDRSEMFLVLEDDQSVLRYIRADWNRIPIPPTGRCHLYSVLAPDRVAYLSPEEFDRQIRAQTKPRPFLVELSIQTELLSAAEGLARLQPTVPTPAIGLDALASSMP